MSLKYVMNASTVTCSSVEYITDGGINVWRYSFPLFPSGLLLQLDGNVSVNASVLKFDPTINAIRCEDSTITNLFTTNSQGYLRSVGHKIYTIIGNNGSKRKTFTQGTWTKHTTGEKYPYSATNNLITVNYIDQNQSHQQQFHLLWNQTAFNNISQIIYLESFLWTWEEIEYYSGLDKNHYPLYKDTNGNYFLTEGLSFVAGRKYNFVSISGDGFNNSITGADIDSGLVTNRKVSKVFYDEFVNNVDSSSTPTLSQLTPIVSEPNKKGRYAAGRLGIQGKQLSVIAYQPNINLDFRYGANSGSSGYTLIPTTNANIENPYVLFDNLENNKIIVEKEWLDQTHFYVKDSSGTSKVFLIPLNWKVLYFTRKVTNIGAPTKKYTVYVNDYESHENEINLRYYYYDSQIGSILRQYRHSIVSVPFSSKPLEIVNNWTFSTSQSEISRTNSIIATTSYWQNYTNETTQSNQWCNISLQSNDPGQWLTNYFDAINILSLSIKSTSSTTNFPIINVSNQKNIFPIPWYQNSIIYTQDAADAHNYDVSVDTDGCSVEARTTSNTYDAMTNDMAKGYCKYILKWQNRGSGLQPPTSKYYSLLDVGSQYKDISRNYNGKTVICEASADVGSGPYGYANAFVIGLSLGIQYQPNSNYAQEWQYLIAIPEENE